MSNPYLEYAKRAFEVSLILARTIHEAAFLFSSEVVVQLSKAWPSFETLLSLIGPLIPIYIIEGLSIYLGFLIFAFIFGQMNKTFWRMIWLSFIVYAVALGVGLGLYFYYSSTATGNLSTVDISNSVWFRQLLNIYNALVSMAGTMLPVPNSQTKFKYQQDYVGRGY
ncbi:hypothetical protein H4R99_005322 [Coemansia sp. RSA 1722]|nr:hypothetical protein H4R99_005322 [Coemansia sp. RSA 1722]KAJ2601322.1 hypothetical protein GGF39_001309 [Coemansia sp. RSA 1721]